MASSAKFGNSMFVVAHLIASPVKNHDSSRCFIDSKAAHFRHSSRSFAPIHPLPRSDRESRWTGPGIRGDVGLGSSAIR